MADAAPTAQNRADIIDASFIQLVRGLTPPPSSEPRASIAIMTATATAARELVWAQLVSRHLDFAARLLRKHDHGYYTIGSSGHEGNVALAHALRISDPVFLHYRSGAFMIERARQGGYPHAIRDVLLGMRAARSEPVAGGRHKVWGSVELTVPPQTSTIASHLPKAVGAAYAIETRRALRGEGHPMSRPRPGALVTPDDAVVMCSFGDASLNHSTAQGAINTASQLAYREQPLPILFVCEDNGIGVSVPTPDGWVAASMRSRPGLRYFYADGTDLFAAVAVTLAAVEHVRVTRRPAFLHLATVRLMGHAGSDVELSYHNEAQIRAAEARDPLLTSARLLVDSGLATADDVLADYERARSVVADALAVTDGAPGLRDAADVMWPIAPRDPAAIAAASVAPDGDAAARARFWEATLPETEGPLTLSAQINRALGDLFLDVPELLLFGQDVAKKGGIYGVTRRLQRRAGATRVFDTLLDEQWILGLAIGAAQIGFIPIAEVQYLAFLHNAADQLRGEASTLQFFSQAQLNNPLVLRLPSYGYQKGFGGHFHNDDSIAALLDMPGVIVASPARGDDAAAMLRTCVAAARAAGSVCLFLEPIALYTTADLYEPGDRGWLSAYQRAASAELGRARTYGEPGAIDLLLVAYANTVRMSLRVARRLARDGVRCRVVDLRWLAPLPVADLARESAAAPRVLLVDETRATGAVSQQLFVTLREAGYGGPLARVTSKDSFVPLGPAADLVLLSEAEIEAAARALVAT